MISACFLLKIESWHHLLGGMSCAVAASNFQTTHHTFPHTQLAQCCGDNQDKMKMLQLVALCALRTVAAPQPPNAAESDESNVLSVDGIEVEGNVIIKPIFDILSYQNGRVAAAGLGDEAADILRRTTPATISAAEASKAKMPGLRENGLFYRGDPRPYTEIFQKGFTPQGSDMNLQHHLSFTGNSGFVSVTRSPSTAEIYAFGRTDTKVEKGYIYVIAPEGMPDGYWVPGIFPPEKNPAVRRNLEFAVAGPVAAQNIVFAYEVSRENPGAKGKKIVNENYRAKSLPPCVGRKRRLCDPAKGPAGAGPDEAKGRKGQGGSRGKVITISELTLDLLMKSRQTDRTEASPRVSRGIVSDQAPR